MSDEVWPKTGEPLEPTISNSIKIGNRGEKIFEHWLTDNCIPRKQVPDFFIDYVIEIAERSEPTGQQFAVQVKGVKVGDKSASPLKYSAKGKHVRYWVDNCQHPVFVFLIDVRREAGHWVFAQKWVNENVSKAALAKQKSFTLKFDAANNLGNKERFFSALRQAEKYVRDLHPGTVSAALKKVRQELEQKEPRLSYEINASEQERTIFLAAKESFELKIDFENEQKEEAYQSFKRAVEHGEPFKFPLNHTKFSGSRLFEEFGGKPGELVLDWTREVAGTMGIHISTGTGPQTIPVPGTFRVGTKTATFHGELLDAPLVATCVFDVCSEATDTSVRFELNHPLQRWQGKPVLHLPYFETILNLFKHFINAPIQIEWLLEGNRIASGSFSGPHDIETQRFLEALSWLARCRAVAAHYQINPVLPEMSKLTSDQMEIVDDLVCLLSNSKRMVPCPDLSARCGLSNAPRRLESPTYGCLCLDNPDPVIHILGQLIKPGPLRTVFTNVNMSPENTDTGAKQMLLINGTSSSLRVLEKYSL
jgi:hypothetical protein